MGLVEYRCGEFLHNDYESRKTVSKGKPLYEEVVDADGNLILVELPADGQSVFQSGIGGENYCMRCGRNYPTIHRRNYSMVATYVTGVTDNCSECIRIFAVECRGYVAHKYTSDYFERNMFEWEYDTGQRARPAQPIEWYSDLWNS